MCAWTNKDWSLIQSQTRIKNKVSFFWWISFWSFLVNLTVTTTNLMFIMRSQFIRRLSSIWNWTTVEVYHLYCQLDVATLTQKKIFQLLVWVFKSTCLHLLIKICCFPPLGRYLVITFHTKAVDEHLVQSHSCIHVQWLTSNLDVVLWNCVEHSCLFNSNRLCMIFYAMETVHRGKLSNALNENHH